MNGEKPKPKTWSEIRSDAVLDIEQLEIALAIKRAIVKEAESQIKSK